jgi:cytosine/adenosine deaminase-related metal-dependent hydrolase
VRTAQPKPHARTLRARYVFPVTAAPIPDGLLSIAGGRIVAVGRQPGGAPGGYPVEDLGNVAVLPGLVNAHTHLEFSDLRRPLGTPGMGFVDWIRRIIELFRQERNLADGPVGRGLRECLRSGTTTLGEIAQPGWPAEVFQGVPLEATVFLELIAPTPERVGPLLELAPQHLRAADPSGPWRPGLSPHAPYSVLPQLLTAAVSLSATGRVPLAFHLAESREELQLLRSGRGPFRDYFDELGTCHPDLFGCGTRPLDYLHTLAAAERTLVIHGNYLDDEEIAFLAEQAERMSVVYCPRTHAYFGHDAYPLEQMLAAGVTVALGTDSRASAPDLSLLAEIRFVADRYPTLARDVVLRLGTINGARALGRDQEIGSLEPGKYANLTVVALPDRDAADPHELLFDSDQPVVATWFRGMLIAEC